MKTSGPFSCAGGPTRHSSAKAGATAMVAALLSTIRRVICSRRDALSNCIVSSLLSPIVGIQPAIRAQPGDLVARIAEFGKDLLGVLAEPRSAAADLRRRAREPRRCPCLPQPARGRVVGLDDQTQRFDMRMADQLV